MDINQIDTFCTQLYTNKIQQIVWFDFAKCQEVLTKSNNQYSIFHAIKSLDMLYNAKTTQMQEMIVMKQFLYTFMMNRFSSIPKTALKSTLILFANLAKKTWFDDTQSIEMINQMRQNVQQNPSSIPMFFSVFTELNNVMSDTVKTVTRKVIQNYRDTVLKSIFGLSIESFKLVLTSDQNNNPLRGIINSNNIEQYLSSIIVLMTSCLTYNFTNSYQDETVDYVSVIQIPDDWKSFFEDIGFIQQLFTVYFKCSYPLTSDILDLLSNISLIKKSLWNRNADTSQFQQCLLEGICQILTNGHNLNIPQTCFSFCRFLERWKANTQIHQLVTTDHIRLFMNFSLSVFTNWETNRNSVSYLLSFWNKMVQSSQMSGEQQTEVLMNDTCLQLLQGLVMSILGFFDKLDYSSDECMLDEDEYKLQDYMESFGTLAKVKYAEMSMFLHDKMEERIQMLYQIKTQNDYQSPLRRKLYTQLCWLLIVTNALLTRGSSLRNDYEEKQALLTIEIFKCITMSDSYLDFADRQNEESIEVKMEFEYMKFFGNFKNLYISTSSYRNENLTLFKTVMGISTLEEIVSKIMMKIEVNLQKFATNLTLINKTLDTFLLFVTSCSQGKMIASLKFTKDLMMNHANSFYGFLSQSIYNPEGIKARIKYYSILGKVLFQDESYDFMQFMGPFDTKLKYIIQTITSGRIEKELASTVEMLLSILVDMQGILSIISTSGQYTKFFEWFFFDYFDAVLCAGVGQTPQQFQSIFFNQMVVQQSPLFLYHAIKFLSNFTYSQYNRINFSNSSPNSILLFRSIVKIMRMIVPLVLQLPEKLFEKMIPRIFSIYNHFLGSNYIPYGVLIYYQDPSLNDFLDQIVSLLFNIGNERLFIETRIRNEVFLTLQGLFKVLYRGVFGLKVDVFKNFLYLLLTGIQSTDENIVRCSLKIVAQIFDVYDSVQTRETENCQMFENQIMQNQQCFAEIFRISITTILFHPIQNQLVCLNGITQLIKHFPNLLNDYKNALIEIQKNDQQKMLIVEQFTGIANNLNENNLTDVVNKAFQNIRNGVEPLN